MISNISIKNFKSIKDISVSTKSLNLLMGLNGMGKSSFLQMLLVLMQSDDLEKKIINLDGIFIDVGQGRDALYEFSSEDFIEFGLCFDKKSEFKWKLHYQTDKDKLTAENGYESNDMQYFRNQTSKFQFIRAERVSPQDLYEASSVIVSDKKQIGISGEYAAYYLNIWGSKDKVQKSLQHPKASGATLLEQINAWMGEISPGVQINTKYVPEIDEVILDYNFTLDFGKTKPYKSKNVGFGITYVLPVLLLLLTAEEGKIIIIENPESHIHPRGQAELGKLIALAANAGSQLFIETHSDHILNGIRVAAKEQKISKDQVNILYFEKKTTDLEQYSEVIPIKVDKNGELSDYPKGFMDEWSEQLLKLF
jgi:predicted ATPase